MTEKDNKKEKLTKNYSNFITNGFAWFTDDDDLLVVLSYRTSKGKQKEYFNIEQFNQLAGTNYQATESDRKELNDAFDVIDFKLKEKKEYELIKLKEE